MPSKVKKRWIERQKARGHHKFVEPIDEVVEPIVVEPVVDETVDEIIDEVVEPTVVEGGTVTDVEVVDEEPVVKKKKTKKVK